MKRKILSVLLALCMLLALMATPIAAAYQDTEGHWAESSIERWTGHGIVQGTENGFDPDGELTCAQLAAILARLLKLPEAPDAGFSDNPAEAWYFDSVNRCAAAGILLGNGDGTVTPNAPITRERAIVMLSRALGIEPIENPDLSAFEDADAVADYAQGYVAALVAAGVIKGVTDETVGPQLNITRAATVAILDRAIAVYADTDGAEIDASEGGFILVAAENVAIKNAPTGTKVLVPPSADGLTVNGKKVESDQTYVVPENKPVTPVHSHSYDETTHKCYCGSFDPAVVATIGDEVGYLTLKDAVAAVEDGGTIKLIKDTTGTGIGTYTTPQTDAEGNLQISAKSFTIDFGNHTYTVNSPAVGSNGFETQGFHFEKSATTNPEIILRNGKIVAAENSGEDMAMLIMNYCSLTLTNMVIDGSNLKDAYYGTGTDRALGPNYTLSNSSRHAAKTLIQNTEIIARSGENNVAFDSDNTSHVTVKGNSIIRGKIEVGTNATLVIFGGTYTVQPTESWIAEGYTAAKSDTEDVWTVTEAEGTSFAAKVGGVKYTTLAAAIAAAAAGDTVTLVGDCEASDEIDVSCNIVLDLNGKTFTSTLPEESYKSALEAVGENASITVRDSGEGGKIISNYYGLSAKLGGHLVMESGTIESHDAALTGNNTAGNMNFTVTGGTLTATEGPAIYMPGQVNLVITGGTLNGGISLRMGQVNISGGTINAVTKNIDSPAEYYSYSGNAWFPDALYVIGGTYNSDDETYGNSLNLNITGGTFNCTNGRGSAVAIYDLGKVEQKMNVTISGDAVLTTDATSRNAYDVLSLGDIGVTSPKTGYNNPEYVGKVNSTITGGTFSSDPRAYVAAGYKATENSGNWTVEKITAEEAAAGIGDVYYLTLADAVAAAEAGDTVTLVRGTTLTSSVEINKSITLDLNGKTIHYTGETQASATQTHRALNVTGGTVTIKNGAITTTVAGTDYSTEFDAVVVKSGADVTLKDMNITINDAKGSCLYVFEGGKATVKSGSYTNTNTSGEKLLMNQKDDKPQAIFVEGGTFDGRNPKIGDNSLNPSTFLAPDYKSVETSAGSGIWTVSKMTWDEYPEDASVVPSGLVITEYPRNEFDSNNDKTGTITIKDKDALLYFAYRLDLAKAYAECGEKAHGTGWGHTCVWYGGAYARHIVLDADIDLEGMTLENGFGNMKDFDFDGQGHKISNVTINYTGTGNTGLFVGGNRGISNLVVEAVKVYAPNGAENAVGIVSSDANANITNVTVRNSSVTGGKYTGAIVGYNYGSVTNCTVENCTVSGRYKVGGIIGYICNSNDVPANVIGNTLTGVTVKGENLVEGKTDFVIGKVVGNWNATTGNCYSNSFDGTINLTDEIGKIEESRCTVNRAEQ